MLFVLMLYNQSHKLFKANNYSRGSYMSTINLDVANRFFEVVQSLPFEEGVMKLPFDIIQKILEDVKDLSQTQLILVSKRFYCICVGAAQLKNFRLVKAVDFCIAFFRSRNEGSPETLMDVESSEDLIMAAEGINSILKNPAACLPEISDQFIKGREDLLKLVFQLPLHERMRFTEEAKRSPLSSVKEVLAPCVNNDLYQCTYEELNLLLNAFIKSLGSNAKQKMQNIRDLLALSQKENSLSSKCMIVDELLAFLITQDEEILDACLVSALSLQYHNDNKIKVIDALIFSLLRVNNKHICRYSGYFLDRIRIICPLEVSSLNPLELERLGYAGLAIKKTCDMAAKSLSSDGAYFKSDLNDDVEETVSVKDYCSDVVYPMVDSLISQGEFFGTWQFVKRFFSQINDSKKDREARFVNSIINPWMNQRISEGKSFSTLELAKTLFSCSNGSDDSLYQTVEYNICFTIGQNLTWNESDCKLAYTLSRLVEYQSSREIICSGLANAISNMDQLKWYLLCIKNNTVNLSEFQAEELIKEGDELKVKKLLRLGEAHCLNHILKAVKMESWLKTNNVQCANLNDDMSYTEKFRVISALACDFQKETWFQDLDKVVEGHLSSELEFIKILNAQNKKEEMKKSFEKALILIQQGEFADGWASIADMSTNSSEDFFDGLRERSIQLPQEAVLQTCRAGFPELAFPLVDKLDAHYSVFKSKIAVTMAMAFIKKREFEQARKCAVMYPSMQSMIEKQIELTSGKQ